jgi:hypothetical protein
MLLDEFTMAVDIETLLDSVTDEPAPDAELEGE